MNILKLGTVRPAGELAVRSAMSAVRLEAPMYAPDALYHNISADWQGDFEGRTMLGQTLLAASTGRMPAYLDENMDRLPDFLNERGYLGPILPDGEFSEQNMSGHSWLLRSLCEYCMYRPERAEKFKAIVWSIVKNLFLPAKDYYASYPVLPEERANGGEMSGSNAGQIGAWHISTDTGCAYIPLDGVSAAYELLGYPEIGELLEEMIRCFLTIDVVKVKLQTHATLSACRGILRMYFLTGRKDYLTNAENIFRIYTQHGMTAAYENQNWFDRPEWTEPCAVIDSFLCAMQLYASTGKTDYLTVAQRIMYNGIYREQRPNGGFGCNSCAVDGTVGAHCYEAYWCCSMRGGEGLARMAQYSYLLDGNAIVVPYMGCSDAVIPTAGDMVHIHQVSDYPYAGKTTFTVDGVTANHTVSLKVWIPAENDYRIIPLKAGEQTIVLTFDLPFHTEEHFGGTAYFCGNLLLGAAIDAELTPNAEVKTLGGAKFALGDTVLEPLGNLWRMTEENAGSDRKRIIF